MTSLGDFGVQGLTPESVARVASPRLIRAEYQLIAEDFRDHVSDVLDGADPLLRGTVRPEVCEEIGRWLLAQASFISRAQSSQAITNSPIRITGEEMTVYRPPRYGRAAIAVVESPTPGIPPAILDVKGCGVPPDEIPVLPHSNGLLTLKEAIHEFLFETIVDSVLEHSGSITRTVPCYAIIDLGFDAIFLDGSTQRATVLVRRAATRPKFQWGREDPGERVARVLLEVEVCLRRHGISSSSCGAVRFLLSERQGAFSVRRDGRTIALGEEELARVARLFRFDGSELIVDGVNVQVTDGLLDDPPRFGVLDFGRYRFCPTFESALYSWYDADFETLRGEVLLPDDPRYPRPIAGKNIANVLEDPVHADLDRAIEAYQAGRIGADELNADLDRFLRVALSFLG